MFEKCLTWEIETYDDFDNPTYASASAVCEEEGSPFYWKTKQLLENGAIAWILCSDEDLHGGEDDFRDSRFDSLEEAQAFCEEKEVELRKEFEKSSTRND